VAAPDRYFTPAEANEALAAVRPLVERMVGQHRAFREAVERRGALSTVTGANGGGFHPRVPADLDAAVEAAAAELSATVRELSDRGVRVKDPATGLVDFPSLRDGEEILLCWLLGEDEVAWWHTLDGGFAGRQPL
jgi:hypothetical protein